MSETVRRSRGPAAEPRSPMPRARARPAACRGRSPDRRLRRSPPGRSRCPTSAIPSATPSRSRTAHSGPSPPECSRLEVTTRSPGFQSTAHDGHVHAVRGCVGQSDIARVPLPMRLAIAARASALRSSVSQERKLVSARPVRSSHASASAMAFTVSRGSGPQTAGVEVDARRRGRERLAESRESSGRREEMGLPRFV